MSTTRGASSAGQAGFLSSYLQKKGTDIGSLQNNPHALGAAARALLKEKGIEKPSPSQISETQYALNEAIAQGTWASFSPRFSATTVQKEDGVQDRLGNIFFENHVFSDADLKLDKLQLDEGQQKKLRGDFESGRSGMMLAATFINRGSRSEGDFTRAYGDLAWRGFMRAHTFLDAIPKGELLERLDTNLIQTVNEKIHAQDTGIKASLLRGIAAIGRGGRFDRGGEIRDGRQFARPEWYSTDEVDAMKEAGVRVMVMRSNSEGQQYAMLEYPRPETVKPRMEEIIQTLKDDLAKPDADPVAAAAQFQRHLVALHPFGDSNGRTSRVLMNRILAEFDLPPAIFRNQNRDVSLQPNQWRRKVAEGVARSKKFLVSGNLKSRTDYLGGKISIRAVEQSPDKPVTLANMPFDLGIDGFLYDPTGRPWMEAGGELVPLSQMGHFILCRRIMQQGKVEGTKTLKALTEKTRALYDKAVADPSIGDGVVVRSDLDVRAGDADYQLRPEVEVAKRLVDLAKIEKIDSAQLFTINRAKGTDVSSTLSKYTQVDLEFWYLEDGLSKAGMKEMASEVRAERSKLFDLAKTHLTSLVDETRVSEDNPLGFTYKYEEMMYNHSPLRFDSFDESVKRLGDKKITVWRGDYSFARLLGMAPNNDIRQDDAKKVANDRADQGQITNLYDDLMKLEGSARGRQYICTTSDLALLAKSFADSEKSRTINLDANLPGIIGDAILAWAAPEPSSTDDETTTPGAKEISDTMGVPGTLLSIRIKDKTRQLDVTAKRKAFRLELDRDALLPGLVALGGHHFEAEQEIHGLERVYPWEIKSAHEAKDLQETFPVVQPPEDATISAELGDGDGDGEVVEVEEEDE